MNRLLHFLPALLAQVVVAVLVVACGAQLDALRVPAAGGNGWAKLALGDQLVHVAVEEVALNVSDDAHEMVHCTLVTASLDSPSLGLLEFHGALPPPLSDERCMSEYVPFGPVRRQTAQPPPSPPVTSSTSPSEQPSS